MTKPRSHLPVLIAALLLLGVGCYLYVTREPSYQGKSLTKWLEEINPEMNAPLTAPSPAREAIRAIGKPGLPILLRLLKAQDSPLKVQLQTWAMKQSLVPVHFRTAWEIQYLGTAGFLALGPAGQDALPELAALLQNTNSAAAAALSLGAIGPAAIPMLRGGVTNPNATLRVACLEGLKCAGSQGFSALPEIQLCLHDAVPEVRGMAVLCVEQFQHEAARVLPPLWQIAQQDPDAQVQEWALLVLGSFTNQASAYVPGLQKMLLSTNANDIPLRETLTNALRNIAPTAWPSGGGMPPADAPRNVP